MSKKEFLRDIMASLLHSHTTGIRYVNFALVIAVFIIGFSIERVISEANIIKVIPNIILLSGSIISLAIIISIFIKKPSVSKGFNPFFFRSASKLSRDDLEQEMLRTIKSEKRIIATYSNQISSLSKTIEKQYTKIKILFGILGISIFFAALAYVVIYFYL